MGVNQMMMDKYNPNIAFRDRNKPMIVSGSREYKIVCSSCNHIEIIFAQPGRIFKHADYACNECGSDEWFLDIYN